MERNIHLIGWTYLDYKNKIVFQRKSLDYNFTWVVPATKLEHTIFKKYYLSKGKTKITFKEFKKHCEFDGVRKNHRIYGNITLNLNQFNVLTEMMNSIERDSFSDALNNLILDYYKLKKMRSPHEKLLNSVKKTFSDFIKNLSNDIKNI